MSDLDVQNINSKTGNAAISIADDGTTTVSTFTSTGIDDNATSTAMTIDASENVGIGTTSPNALVEVQEDVTDTYSASASSAPNVHLQISNEDTTTANTMSLVGFGSRGTTTTTSQWYIGNVGMNNAYADSSFVFGHRTAGSTWSEVMRLDGSGQLLFDCTTNNQLSDEGIKLVSGGRIFTVSPFSNSSQESLTMYSTGASAFRFYVDWGGTIHATSTSISGISDERLKENIVDLETGLTEVMALKPRRFDWKDDDKKNVAGFVAQEIETVLPDLVDQFKHNTLEDAKGVRVGDMIPTLVKAIQEQQAMIEDLESRLSAVEAN